MGIIYDHFVTGASNPDLIPEKHYHHRKQQNYSNMTTESDKNAAITQFLMDDNALVDDF
jgi:hypothetical protein